MAAHIKIDGDILRIESPADVDICSGPARIFFVNIMDASLAEEFHGYFTEVGSGTAKFLEEVLEYLATQGIEAELDQQASSLLNTRAEQAKALEAARVIGERLKTEKIDAIAVPGLLRTLKPYQIPAVAHMLELQNAANFSVPGSGKTTMVLAAFAKLKELGTVEKLLIVGPRSCFMPWEEEYKACFGVDSGSVRLVGSKGQRTDAYRRAKSSPLVLLSYQMMANDADEIMILLRSHRFMMVLDESHYIKKLAGGVWSSTLLDLAPLAAKRVILSGTPVPNGLLDLWSQMTFLWPNPPILGTRERFKSRVGQQNEASIQAIRAELQPFFWRVKKSDVKLPVPTFHRIPVPLLPYQSAIYDALAAKVLSDVEHHPKQREKLRIWRKAKMVRMLQAASNPSLMAEYSPEFRIPPLDGTGLSIEELVENYSKYETPAKLSAVCDTVNSLVAKGLKVVIWSAFVHNISTLAKLLEAHKPRVIHGAIPKDDNDDAEFNRELMIKQFKTEDEYPVLIANPAACAESISLHKICLHAIYLDRTFNGAQYMQSLDRIHRLGLDDNDHVHYYIMQAVGTIDELIDQRLEEKRSNLLKLLEGDLQPVDLDLDPDETEISEGDDETEDFEAMIAFIKKKIVDRAKRDPQAG